MIQFSQFGEDIILKDIFKHHIGFYVDIGAGVPSHASNTYAFYLAGWRGVLIEPLKERYAELVAQRPEDVALNVAIADFDGEAEFFRVENDLSLSSLSKEIAGRRGQKVTSFPVTVHRMDTLIRQHGIPVPDFISIDVEGKEKEVLLSIPFDCWLPRALVIESVEPNSEIATFSRWEHLILPHGYVLHAATKCNRIYTCGRLD